MSLDICIKKKLGKYDLELVCRTDSRRLAILGPSGCGKSISLKAIAGIEQPDEGHIVINEKELFSSSKRINLKPQKRRVGYLFQNYALFPTMTVAQNIGAAVNSKQKNKEETVRKMASVFQIEDILDQYPGNISGGQQQRVAIARMLMSNPEVLLFDEPFSALDSFLKEELHNQLKRLLDSYEGTSIIVTHDREEAYEFSDTILLMYEGKIIQMGPTREVFANPDCEIARRIVGDKYLSMDKSFERNIKCDYTGRKTNMQDKLNKIKVVFADVDNTLLCLKMYDDAGKRIVGFENQDDWLKFNINTNAYIRCQAPRGVKNLVDDLHFHHGVKIYGLTECSNSFEYNSKFHRLNECYPGIFEHHGDLISTETRHKKVMIMKMIAERDGYNMDEIMFIDDSYTEVMEAFAAGMFAMHTTEVMERFM